MTVDTIEFPRAFAVWFRDLDRWDASSFHRIKWHWPQGVMAPIGSVLRLRKERVDKAAFKFSDLQPITIHFDGSVDKRIVDANREYSMDLWFARPGDIVVAKIDLKNGAVGIVPPDWKTVVVTGHFAVYEPDRARLVPEYLHRIIQAGFFKAHLWRNKVGAEGRKEVKLDFFEKEHIPLPSLAEQKAIVARWRKAQDDIASAKARVAAITLELEHGLLNKIGLEIEPPTPQRGAFALFWGDLERWDTFFYRKDFVALKHSLARINRKKLGDLASFISRHWKHESFPDGFFKYVEISSVSKEDGIFSSKVVGLKEAPSRATTLICKGDLIISATRPYLGAIAIVPEAYDNHVCSSGFALVDTVDNTHILKEYLLFFLKSQGGLKQMEQRMTGGLYPAITQDELEKIEIPLPPLSVQKQIMERVAAGREEIAREREAANRIAREINAEIEALILGTKKVSEL